ncbi:MAG: hypothetical protein ACNA78_10980 [Balneolaceae bacterium]
MDKKLQKKLAKEERKREREALREQNDNPYITSAIIFFSTFGPLYFVFFLFNYVVAGSLAGPSSLAGFSVGWIYPLIHAFIWIVSIISVYRKKSVLEYIF